MSFFASWMLNPLMLGLGAFAIAVPIIIHLLNKRRFKIVEWAAMDFLFDADKKNRRRVRLENFLLLLLRCLVMLLIGFLLARPFLPSSISKTFAKTQQFERIILLDDSLSQQVSVGNGTTFDVARLAIKDLLNRAAVNDTDDSLTLFLTSQPDKPILSNHPISVETMEDKLIRMMDEMKCSDMSTDYGQVLDSVLSHVEDQREDVNRVVYLMTDLRQQDWQPVDDQAAANPNEIVKKISENENVAGCFVVDTGIDSDDNLTIVDIQPEDLLVANSVIRFNVTVANNGSLTAQDIGVRFQVGEEAPQVERIGELTPGKQSTITFRYMFNYDRTNISDNDIGDQLEQNLKNYPITVELMQEGRIVDLLRADSVADYVARVQNGIPVLLVDGQADLVPERSETHFLSSTEVRGTGLLTDMVTHTEFESVSLSKYGVIFLCNVSDVSSDRLKALRQWVEDGGGLVLMPGSLVRPDTFNATFFKEGKGLSPFQLISRQGDPNRQDYKSFDVTPGGHPGLAVVDALESVFNSLKIYQWFSTAVAEGQFGTEVIVPLRLTDENNSIAMAERTTGKGRVIGFSFSADLDWTDWPPHPSYAPVISDLIHYLASRDAGLATTVVGGSVAHPVDLSIYDGKVGLIDPQGEKIEANAKPYGEDDESKESVLYQVRFDEVRRRGVYEMQLLRNDRTQEKVLFAANVDPDEGKLKRLNVGSLGEGYFGDQTKLVTSEELASHAVSGGQNEIWPQLLLLLGAVLGIEQLLAWWFGKRR